MDGMDAAHHPSQIFSLTSLVVLLHSEMHAISTMYVMLIVTDPVSSARMNSNLTCMPNATMIFFANSLRTCMPLALLN